MVAGIGRDAAFAVLGSGIPSEGTDVADCGPKLGDAPEKKKKKGPTRMVPHPPSLSRSGPLVSGERVSGFSEETPPQPTARPFTRQGLSSQSPNPTGGSRARVSSLSGLLGRAKGRERVNLPKFADPPPLFARISGFWDRNLARKYVLRPRGVWGRSSSSFPLNRPSPTPSLDRQRNGAEREALAP